jgi:hypothetical protein
VIGRRRGSSGLGSTDWHETASYNG